MEKKYKLTEETINVGDKTLHRIEAVRDFANIKKGDKGGYVEKEENLSQSGDCWVYDDAMVCGKAMVYGNAKVFEDARIYGKARVLDNAVVRGNAKVFGNALVCENAKIYDNVKVCGNVEVYGNAKVYDDVLVCDDAQVYGNAKVYDDVLVCDDAQVYGYAWVCGDARVYGNARVYDNATISSNANVYDNAAVYGNARIYGNAEITADTDYIVFKNWWSSGRFFTWTRSNNMWKVGCFYGTGEQLIEKAYKDSELSGKEYKKVVVYVNSIKDNEYDHVRKNIKERLLSKIRKLFGK